MHRAQRLVKNRVAIDCLAQPLATVFGHKVVEPSPAAYLQDRLVQMRQPRELTI